MMNRRAFHAGALAVLLAPLTAAGQQPDKVYRIGVLQAALRPAHLMTALEEGLRDLGYVESRNVAIDYRYADGGAERLRELAAELVRLKPDVIVALHTPAALAAKQVTATIPIVMVSPADPVSAGLVGNLAHPAGNVTGLTFTVTVEIYGKRLHLLQEVVPQVRRIGVLWNPAYKPNADRWKALQEPARTLGVTLLSGEVRAASDVEPAFRTMIQRNVQGLLVFGDPLVFALRERLADLAAKNRLPTISPSREEASVGGLMSYGPDYAHTYRRAASYIDKILRGAKPADLPVEQPTKFELVINLKTAKALGLTIPPALLLRADQVIE